MSPTRIITPAGGNERMMKGHSTPSPASVQPRGTRNWAMLITFWVLLAMLASPSEQRGGGGHWGTEYPLVPWEDMWQEADEMTDGISHCLTESSTCWHSSNTSTSPIAPSRKRNTGLCRQCACDEECVRYGDCCRDKAQADWGDGREEGSSRYGCRRMRPWDTVGLLMVESCLPEYSGTPYERFCTQQVPPEAYSYTLDVSVTSRLTNMSYANYYCAVCNNDASDLHTWTLSINCKTYEIKKEFTLEEFMRKATYLPGRMQLRRYVYKDEDYERRGIYRESLVCILEVAEFTSPTKFVEMYGGRLCIYPKAVCEPKFIGGRANCREQVRNCDPAWPDRLDVEKCRRYSQLVVYRSERNKITVYKNPHCARCNFINITSSNFECFNPLDNNICTVNKHIRTFRLPQVFSVLMDFRDTSCRTEDEVWDPIHASCRKIYCGRLYKLSNGECVRDPEAFAALENSTLLDNSCHKIKLSEDEFIPRTNGSLFVNATNKVYKHGDYEMFDNGTVLVCARNEGYIASLTTMHQLLTLITMVISLVGLGLHITIYILVPRHRNLPGKNLFSLSCCLFLAYLIFLTGIQATDHQGVCVFLSATLHFFWLASFCWMSVMSVDVCRTFTSQVYRGDTVGKQTYVYYSIYAWSIPFLVVTLALIFNYVDILPDYRPEYATDLCWINNRYGLALFFLLPQGAIVLENTLLYLVTARGIYKQVKASRYASTRSQSLRQGKEKKTVNILRKGGLKEAVQGQRKKKERIRLILYVKLAVIQGLSWGTGFIATFADVPVCWYFFTVFNGLQGAFIFLAFDMKRKVWESVWEAVMGKPWPKRKSSKDTRTTTSGRTPSDQNHESDSEEENKLDAVLSKLLKEKDVGWQSGEGGRWSSSSAKYIPPSHILNRVSSQQTRKLGTTAAPLQTFEQQLASPVQEDESPRQVVAVRKGDLRPRVVRGNFDGEGREETLKDDDESTKQQPANSKPDVQRVMDLLQQLQQSRSSVDLPDLVQQLLKRTSIGSPVAGGRKPIMLSKCRSFTEGTYPDLQKEQQKALVARLTSMMNKSLATYKADGSHHPEDGNSHLPSRLISLVNTANTSHNSLYSPSRHRLSPQVTDEEDTVFTHHHQPVRSQEALGHPKQIPKSQSFSQISKVALAASVMQKAAVDARERRCHEAERTKVGICDDRGKSQYLTSKETITPESLV